MKTKPQTLKAPDGFKFVWGKTSRTALAMLDVFQRGEGSYARETATRKPGFEFVRRQETGA